MRQFTIRIENQQDIPAVLSEALANMESLKASREQWASLLDAMGVNLWFQYHKDAPKMNVREAAEAIIAKAVPEEGIIHPLRALFVQEEPYEIHFMSPGGVGVSIVADVTSARVRINFGRNSSYLATLVLADMFRRVPAAAPLLAQAAAEAAAKYEATTASV
jgi:hypothetical protein